MPNAQDDIYGKTYKLIEEVKIYWTVQTLAAPAIGYLLSQYKPGAAVNTLGTDQDFANLIYCFLAILPLIIGITYNIAGAGYILQSRLAADLPVGRDLLCSWLQIGYMCVSGLIGVLLLKAIRHLAMPYCQLACSPAAPLWIARGMKLDLGLASLIAAVFVFPILLDKVKVILLVVFGILSAAIAFVALERTFYQGANTTALVPFFDLAGASFGIIGAREIAKLTYRKLAIDRATLDAYFSDLAWLRLAKT